MLGNRSTYGLFAGGTIIMMTGLLLVRAPLPDTASATPKPLFSAVSPQDEPSPGVDVRAPSVSHLKSHFSTLGYTWERADERVPRVRLTAFPRDLGSIREVAEKKRLFFQSMLPLILMENERILADRRHMDRIYARLDRGLTPAAEDADWLTRLATRYRIVNPPFSPNIREELHRRVNAVPLSLALAMAANESAWGTSRFAEEGNNLFGQWTFSPGTGLVPKDRPEGERYEVAVFPDLASSVRAYLENLNTHWAYQDFRRIRAGLTTHSEPGAGIKLARSLTRYSERGEAYTDDLVRLIRVNGLGRFNATTLAPANPDARS